MQDLIIIGAATPTIIRVIEDINENQVSKFRILGFVDSDPAKHGREFYGIPVIGNFESCLNFDKQKIQVINTIAGSIKAREQTTQWFLEKEFQFTNIVHPSVNLKHCKIGTGNLVYENATIHPYVTIGNHCVVSSNSGIAHESVLHDYCFIGPASYICGKVIIEDRVFIGVGAHILPRLKLKSHCTVAAGALVTKSIDADKRVCGIPAREF